MALLPSAQPANKTIEGEAKVNQDDPKVETSVNPLSSSSSPVDWYLGSDSDGDGFGKFDDEGMDMVEEDSRSSSSDDEFLVNVATLPVGIVLSVKGKQVMVEGREKSNLLSTGCFLWITETRVPLGYVDEIFGTVEKPCYSVRLELGSQVPQGIRQGTQVSLIVTDSVQHAKKGSSVNDETVFSDDGKQVCPVSVSHKSPVKPQSTHGTDGLVPTQDQQLPRTADSTAKSPYRHPMSKEKSGTVAPVQSHPPMMYHHPIYSMPPFGSGLDHMNLLPYGFPNAPAPWPDMNPNPYRPSQRPKMQPPPPSQKSKVGLPSSDHRGKLMNHRGAGSSNRGFGRGRGRRDDKNQKRW